MLRKITFNRRRNFFVVALVLIVAGLLGGTTRDGATATNPPSVYCGLSWTAIPWDPSALAAAEAAANKKFSILSFAQPWQDEGVFQSFDPNPFNAARDHGSIPMITWASWNLRKGTADFQSADITAGTYDTFIWDWATEAKDWGHPFFMRYDWEMNGWWYPWGEGMLNPSNGQIINGNHPGDFVKMWRHVRDIFTQVGATNVTWVWCPNIMSTGANYP